MSSVFTDIGGVDLTFMMCLTVADVVTRSFNYPMLGAYEMVTLSLKIVINRCKPPALPGRLPEFDNSWNIEIDSVRKIQRTFVCQRLWAINNYVFTSCRDEVGTRIHHETKKGSTRI